MKIQKKHFFRIFIISAIVLLFLPHILRYAADNDTLPGEEPYYHARIAQQLTEQGSLQQDTFAFNVRPYVFSPYHYLLALFSLVFGVITASKIVPFILGLLSAYLLYRVLQKLKINSFSMYSVLGIFIFSQLFTYAFSVSSEWCLIIFLNLLGLCMFMQNKKWFIVIAALCFGLSSLFGIIHALFSGAIVFFYSYYNKKKTKNAYVLLALIAVIILAYNVPTYLNLGHYTPIEADPFTDFISDLGGIAGFSIFTLLLALLGLFIVWKYKGKYYSLYAFSIFLIVYSFFNKTALIYSNFIIVFLAGIAFSSLAKMKWQLARVRDLCLVVLFCGILFSTLSHAILLSDIQPDNDFKDALLWLNHRSDPDDKIFSHYSKGFWIEFWGERPVLTDSLFEHAFNAELLYKDSITIFQSNDIKITQQLLAKHKIKYIFLTKDMSQGLVWEKEDLGLNFLLSNNETFKKRYNNPCCEIYEYIYQAK